MKPSICSECSLAKIGSGFVPVEVGPRYQQNKLLIIGEAPGEAEARDGKPFRPYAQSGSLLADAMRAVNIQRGDVAITNMLQCRPPKDWLEGAPYSYNALSNCTKNFLYDTINRLKPTAILALGGTAMRALTASPKGKYGTLDYLRGYVQMGEGVAQGIPVIASYHPAFIRRGSPELTPLLQKDLRRAFRLANGQFVEGKHYSTRVENLSLNYQIAPTLEDAWNYAHSLDKSLPIAFDIETPVSTRSDEDERTSFTDRDIRLFQCTQRRGSGIAIPFRDEFVEVIRFILGSGCPLVGFNNWSFDDPVLATNAIKVGPTDDAMVMFGFFWSDLPKNLQAAAQSCGFQFPWKHLGETDLEFYGCCDVDATLCVYQFMRNLLERENLWKSYRRYFAQLWPILRDMAARGIPISEEKRQELKRLIIAEDEKVTAQIQSLVPEEFCNTKQKFGLKREPKDKTGMVLRQVTVEKEEKCQCTKKNRAVCPICKGSGIVPVGTVLPRWGLLTAFNPNSSPQVKCLIKGLGHTIPKHAKRTDESGEAADTTEMKELERLSAKTKHPIYPLLIQKRMLTKTDGTYCEGWKPTNDGCVHTTYTYQTGTWQTSSRSPNCQNGLKHGKTPFQKELATGFNGMQRALLGRILINFDFKSFHALTTAYDFNLPEYARLARIDIHSFITCHFLRYPLRDRLWSMADDEMAQLFKELKKNETFKFTRDFKAKRAILGIQFGMGYRKLYQLNSDDFDSEGEARKVWELVYSLFPGLRMAQDKIRRRAADEGLLINRFGAVRHFFDVERFDRRSQKFVAGDQSEQAVAFLPASHAFGHMRETLLACNEQKWDEIYGFCNQIHDSIIAHCDLDLKDQCIKDVKGQMERESTVLVYPPPMGVFHVEAEATMGNSMAELK